MILLLDTSTPTCEITLYKGTKKHKVIAWEAHRQLADKLLLRIDEALQEQQESFQSLTGIGVFKGPGSYTGLRIGITVCNALADSLSIPVCGGTGHEWREQVVQRLEKGEDDRLVLPEYGAAPHITSQRK